MRYELNLNDRAFEAVINQTKKVEIRANTNGKNYGLMKYSDVIEFTNSNGRKIVCRVLEVNHYDTLEELFTLEGTKYTTSSTDDYKIAIQRINALNGYEEAISKAGVYAIHIKYLYELTNIWEELYKKCKDILNGRDISDSVSAGGVAAAILTKKGNIYTGVCIDTACSLGFCAERNAIGKMPYGACRELMLQLSYYNNNMKIMTNLENKESITLSELIPNWWKQNLFKCTILNWRM